MPSTYAWNLDHGNGSPLPAHTESFIDAAERKAECSHDDAERLSVCCGRRELGEESDICSHPECRDHTGFEMVCECGAILPDERYAK